MRNEFRRTPEPTESLPATNDRPYKQTFSYDNFSHLTNRDSNIWSAFYSTTDAYANNRNSGYDYDADGNLLNTGETTYTYDASGEVGSVATVDPQSTTTRTLDGYGRQTKTVASIFDESSQTWIPTTTYYIHSTVLGGAVLTELKESGTKHRTFVYAGGQVFATQEILGISTYEQVTWEHRDPSNASYRTTMTNGDVSEYAELDPAGADAGIWPPIVPPHEQDEGTGSLLPYPSFSNPSRPNVGYSVDRIPVSMDYLRMALDSAFPSRFGLVESAARASAPRFVGYTVSAYNGRLNRYFGSNLAMAGKEAIEQGHYTVTRNWLVSDGWGFDVSSLPQDTVSKPLHWWDLAKIRTDLKKIGERGRCQQFLTKLLERAGERGRDKPRFTDIVDLFDAVFLQRGFVSQTEVSGRGFSSVDGAVGAPGGAQVRLSVGSEDFKSNPSLRIRYYAYDALSELTHVAGSKPSGYVHGAFSDYNLAKVALDVANEMGTGVKNQKLTIPTHIDPNNDPYGRWSNAYHGIVGEFCKRNF